MRVLITAQHQGSVGGIETYLRAVSPNLVAAGHEVAWLFAVACAANSASVNGANTTVWFTEGRSGESLRAIEQWNPDVVYANGLHDARWDAILARKYPTVYFMHGYFGACISGKKTHGSPPTRICTRALAPACLMLYMPARCGGRNPIRMLASYKAERSRQRNLTKFPDVVVASRHMADEYLRQGGWVERIHTIPLFPTDAKPDESPPSPRARTGRVLFVGRLTDLKGVQHAAAAVAAATAELGRPLTLVVAGDGPGMETLVAEASRWRVPAEFLGWVNPHERNEQMRKADVLIVPSVWPEPFGLVGIEAACVGLPAAAFAVGGVLEWLTAEVSGELAEAGAQATQTMAAAIVRVLDSDSHWQRLRHGAWEVSKRFRCADHVEALLEVLSASTFHARKKFG